MQTITFILFVMSGIAATLIELGVLTKNPDVDFVAWTAFCLAAYVFFSKEDKA